MKRLTLACTVLTAATASAQTNTYPFPSSGNVGIGTTSPSTTLHLATPGEVQLRLQNNSRQWAILSNEYWGNSGFSIYDITSDNSRLQITTNGNVGIGTLSPSAKLDVTGGINFSDRLYKSTSSPGGVNPALISAQSEWNAGEIPILNLGYDQGLGGTDMDTKIWSYARTPQESRSFISIGRNRTDLSTPAFTITGNVGIGTTAPQGLLHLSKTNANAHLILDPQSSGSGDAALRLIRNGINNEEFRIIAAAGGASGQNNVYLFDTIGNPHARDIQFRTSTNGGSSYTDTLRITTSGNVGIGTTNPTHKLAVNGTIKAKEIIVETTGWSDYVFADDYRLAPLSEVEAHIAEKKHLPGIPSAAEVATDGISLGDMQARLLAKIEELTLHQIAQEKRLASQAGELTALRAEVRTLRAAH